MQGRKKPRKLKKKRRSRRNRRINFLILCFIVFLTFVGIGKSVGEKLNSRAASGKENISESGEKLDLEKDSKESSKDKDKKEDKNHDEKLEGKSKKDDMTEKEKSNKEKDAVKSEKSQAKDIKETEKEAVEKNTSDDGKKVAYLTFDDGPSRNITPKILDVLDTYNTKATFFVIGSLAEQNPELIKREHNSGHAIGNHTYSHDYKYIYANVDNLLADIQRAENVLKNILGDSFQTNSFRFPGGSFGSKKQPFKKVLNNKGIAHIDWNALNGDAEGHNISSSRLVERVVQTTQGKNKVVILMHDAGAKKTTLNALPEIIEYLKKEGYEFKTIDQEAINGL